MKKSFIPLITGLFLLLWSCSGGSNGYDETLCRDLAIKIETGADLSQTDYSRMIEQDEAILKYLVDRNKEISELPDSSRCKAWRTLTADPEYLERFGYMFTIGSALYSAQIAGNLDSRNLHNYDNLDRYNEQLARYSERL